MYWADFRLTKTRHEPYALVAGVLTKSPLSVALYVNVSAWASVVDKASAHAQRAAAVKKRPAMMISCSRIADQTNSTQGRQSRDEETRELVRNRVLCSVQQMMRS